MAEDMIFTENKAVLSNLSRLAKEYFAVNEQRLLEVYDVAIPMADTTESLFDEGLNAGEALSALSPPDRLFV